MGNYRILYKIAQGGMAEIFKAEKIGLNGFNKPVALKKIWVGPNVSSKDYRKMLSEEANVALFLEHSNIVHFYDYFEHDNVPYIAFQYVDGLNLGELLNIHRSNRRFIPLNVYLYVICETLKGLDYAHKKQHKGKPLNIIHRDVSPQNILLGYDGIVKLADFGIAKANIDREETQLHMLKGKVNYLAPEQVRFEKVTQKVDLYAIGMMLFEYIYAYNPYLAHDQQTKILNDIAQNNKLPQRPPIIKVSQELLDIINKAMSINPEERFSDAKSLRNALIKHLDPSWLVNGNDLLQTYLKQFKEQQKTRPKISKPVKAELSQEKRKSSTRIATYNLESSFKKTLPSHYLKVMALLIVTVSAIALKPNTKKVNTKRESEKTVVKTEVKELPKPQIAKNVAKKPQSKSKVLYQRPKITTIWRADTSSLKESAKPKVGSVYIDGPYGSEVYINGYKFGGVPLKKELKVGSYKITIVPEWEMPYTTEVSVKNKEEYIVQWKQ